jgi:hypothetical protein
MVVSLAGGLANIRNRFLVSSDVLERDKSKCAMTNTVKIISLYRYRQEKMQRSAPDQSVEFV